MSQIEESDLGVCMRILVFILALIVLLAIILHKGPATWDEASIKRWVEQVKIQFEAGGSAHTQTQKQTPIQTQVDAKDKNTGVAVPTPSKQTLEQQVVMYQWRDEQGQLHVTQTPPTDREYKTISYKVSESVRGKRPDTRQRMTMPYSPPQTTNEKDAGDTNLSQKVPVHCQFAVKRLQRYEKKLNSAQNVAESIWLHDYCEALSELITNDCRLSKSDVSYNRYCPLRYRR